MHVTFRWTAKHKKSHKNIATMEIEYNIRIFIQLSAKQQHIYNSTVWQIVTWKLWHQINKYLKDLK